MTKKLEEILNIDIKEEKVIASEDATPISTIDLQEKLEEFDKISAALPRVKGLGDMSDVELDGLAAKAEQAGFNQAPEAQALPEAEREGLQAAKEFEADNVQESINGATVDFAEAKQVEQAKLQVSKDTPIFSVLKPVVVPNEKSAPKKLIIILVWSFLGFSISVANILFKDSLFSIINKIKS